MSISNNAEKIRQMIDREFATAIDESFSDTIAKLATVPNGEKVTLAIKLVMKPTDSSLAYDAAVSVTSANRIKHDIQGGVLEFNQLELDV